MKRKRFSEEQIIGVLKEAEAGAKTADLARRHGVSEATIYNWRSKYGGLEVSEARRLKALEDENAKLKRLLGRVDKRDSTVTRILFTRKTHLERHGKRAGRLLHGRAGRRARRARAGRHHAARTARRLHGRARLYRARRPALEARLGPARTAGLPRRPHDHG